MGRTDIGIQTSDCCVKTEVKPVQESYPREVAQNLLQKTVDNVEREVYITRIKRQ